MNLFRLWSGPQKRRSLRRFAHSCEPLEVRQVLSTNAIFVAGSSLSPSSTDVRAFLFNSGAGTFGTQVQSSVSLGAEFVGMGDVDGDGDQDIISKTPGLRATMGFFTGTSSIQVSLNNGSGSFSSSSTWDTAAISSNSGAYSWMDHQVGDFNGDGMADLIARLKDTGEWHLWTSTGTAFTETTFGTWNAGVQWRDAMIGDFDGDGLMDLLGRQVTNSTSSGATDEWYIGLGTSSATDRGTVGVSGNSWWHVTSTDHFATVANTVVGDYDGDGVDEFAIRLAGITASDGSRPSEWLLAKPGTVGSTVTANTATALTNWDHSEAAGVQNHWTDIQSGDFDGDGLDDILGRTEFGRWWLSLGTSTSLSSASQVADWNGLGYEDATAVTGDFTGDGLSDLVVRDVANDRWLLAQYSSGAFGTPAAAGGSTSGAMGNPDRKRTFATGDPSGYSDYTTYQQSLGTLGSSDPLALLEIRGHLLPGGMGGDSAYSVGRYNANGSFDFENQGGASASTYMSISSGSGFTGDFNGDGLLDALAKGLNPSSSGTWYLSINQGNGYQMYASSSLPSSFGGMTQQYRIGDFTGDGKDDFLVQIYDNYTTAHWELFEANSSGTDFNSSVTVANLSSTTNDGWMTGGEVGDFDGDGIDDLVVVQNSQDPSTPNLLNYYVATSNGTSTWSIGVQWSRTHASSGAGTYILNANYFLKVGDFDGDGISDVTGLQNYNTYSGMTLNSVGQVWVGLGGGGGWTTDLPSAFNTSAPYDSHILEVGRFASSSATNDTYSDILVKQNYDTTMYVWQSTGSSFGTSSVMSGTFPGTYYGLTLPLISDVDHDGFDDVLWQSTGYHVSLMVRSNIVTIGTPNTGWTPPSGINSLDTTIHRVRRQR